MSIIIANIEEETRVMKKDVNEIKNDILDLQNRMENVAYNIKLLFKNFTSLQNDLTKTNEYLIQIRDASKFC